MNPSRDLTGYGPTTPQPNWPQRARIAVNFVVNYEEGAEQTPVNGDATAESYGGEFAFTPKPPGMRDFSMESLFEYGSRCGFWRIMRLFETYQIPITVFACGLALQLNSEVAAYLKQSPHEVAGHAWRWINYTGISEQQERKHIQHTIDIITETCGSPPCGWYTGRISHNTRKLLLEYDNFLYDSDSYADDLPYFYQNSSHLIIPYSLETNDFRFITTPGFSGNQQFYQYLKDAFDYLYQEGATHPKMLSIGLHPRICGRPARCQALKQFIEYVYSRPNVWIARRVDIARHWRKQFS